MNSTGGRVSLFHVGKILLLICRVDNNVQDLRAKIFPSVGKKAKAPELVLSVPQPGKRREKSLSSLAFSTPRLLAQSGQVGRRITFAARKHLAPQESILFSGEPVNKEEEVDKKVRDHPVSSSSTGTPSETVQNRRQVKEAKLFIFFAHTQFNPLFFWKYSSLKITKKQATCFVRLF